MAKSARAKRMAKHHRRNKGKGTLNLVSLMDIFTILVFFLLVNSSDVQTLPNAKDLQLPESFHPVTGLKHRSSLPNRLQSPRNTFRSTLRTQHPRHGSFCLPRWKLFFFRQG